MEEIFREQTMATAESSGERPGFIQECEKVKQDLLQIGYPESIVGALGLLN